MRSGSSSPVGKPADIAIENSSPQKTAYRHVQLIGRRTGQHWLRGPSGSVRSVFGAVVELGSARGVRPLTTTTSMTEKFPSWFLRYRFDHTENGRLRTRRGGEAPRGEPRPRPDVGFSESHASQWPPKTAW